MYYLDQALHCIILKLNCSNTVTSVNLIHSRDLVTSWRRRRWRTEDVSGVRVRSPGRGWRILPRDIGATAIGPPSPVSRLSSVLGRWWPCLCSPLLHPQFFCRHSVVYDLALKLSASPTQLLQESSHAAVLQECKCRVLRMQHEKLGTKNLCSLTPLTSIDQVF